MTTLRRHAIFRLDLIISWHAFFLFIHKLVSFFETVRETIHLIKTCLKRMEGDIEGEESVMKLVPLFCQSSVFQG